MRFASILRDDFRKRNISLVTYMIHRNDQMRSSITQASRVPKVSCKVGVSGVKSFAIPGSTNSRRYVEFVQKQIFMGPQGTIYPGNHEMFRFNSIIFGCKTTDAQRQEIEQLGRAQGITIFSESQVNI